MAPFAAPADTATRPLPASPLADRLLERTGALVQRAVAAAWADPFWDARFGARGRSHAAQDTAHTLSYLALSLRFGSSEILVTYTRWLQTVLTSRGMCTRQLARYLADLQAAVRAEGIDDEGRAAACLQDALDGLRYADEPAATLQTRAPELVDRVVARLGEPVRDEAATLLSYLADSVALGKPEMFAAHVTFAAAFAERRGRPAGSTAALLDAIEAELASSLASLPDPAAVALHAARARLSGR